MLIAVDIGNTNIVLGFIEDEQVAATYRITTKSNHTSDEFGIMMLQFLQLKGFAPRDVHDVIITSVVPKVMHSFTAAIVKFLGITPMVVGPGIRTGMNIHIDDPRSLGADCLADCAGAYATYGGRTLVIDMGTATTIGVISEGRTYEGGLLLPGVQVSLEALSRRAAQLPDISLQHPKALIGKSTEDCMRSGIVYGTAGMLDGIIDRIREEFAGKDVSVVATGGNAPVIVRYCKNEIVYDKYLLMNGLRAIYERNR